VSKKVYWKKSVWTPEATSVDIGHILQNRFLGVIPWRRRHVFPFTIFLIFFVYEVFSINGLGHKIFDLQYVEDYETQIGLRRT
jgi:hypothetical protein